jgi:hypothetical protein
LKSKNQVASAWKIAGLDVDDCFQKACSVTNEWKYSKAQFAEYVTTDLKARVSTRASTGWKSQIKLRTLREILLPQHQAADIFQAFLAWIDQVDEASQKGMSRPVFRRADGSPIFPVGEKWWLTEAQQRGTVAIDSQRIDGDGPCSEDEAKAGAHQDSTEEEWSDDGDILDYNILGEDDVVHVFPGQSEMQTDYKHSLETSSELECLDAAKPFVARLMWKRKGTSVQS